MKSLISVIIPVYQAEKFIEEAVKSCAFFDEVGEVLLIEDGSTDGSLNECQRIVQYIEKVKLFCHKDNENRGPSASRNLGIEKAEFPFIAFLDADDYFLPNRFESFKLFLDSVDFDGIYQPVQYFNGSSKIYGIRKEIPPRKLFYYLIRGTYGHFHTNGLIVKRDLLVKAGLFNETLKLHQDSELWLKLAFYGRLVSGNISLPVSMVRVHEGNRIWKGTSNSSRLNQWKVTWRWAWNKPVGFVNKLLILRKLFKYKKSSLKER